jgi:hypothetical protein
VVSGEELGRGESLDQKGKEAREAAVFQVFSEICKEIQRTKERIERKREYLNTGFKQHFQSLICFSKTIFKVLQTL